MELSESLKTNRRKGQQLFLIFSILTILLELRLLVVYDLPAKSWYALMGTLAFFFVLLIKRVQLHIASWWLYIYMFGAFIIVPSFKYVTSMSMSYSNIIDKNFASLSATAINLIFIFYITLAIFYKKRTPHRTEEDPIVYINYKPLFLLAFILSILSHFLGIGRMGVESYPLPFHLSGVIQFYRAELFPLLALIEYAKIKRLKDNHSMKLFLTSYSIWALYECILRLSKSALLTSFIPIIILEMLSLKKVDRSFLKKIAPILLVTLGLFIIIPVLRMSDGKIDRSEIMESGNEEMYGTSNNSYLVKPFTRVFYSGYLYLVDKDYFQESPLFDFSKAPIILLTGGSARYQTIVIDGYPEENVHSSGSSPFIDSLLLGGYGLLYVTLAILALFALFIDNKIRGRANILSCAILCAFFYRIFDMLSFSIIVDMNMVKWTAIYLGVLLYIRYKQSRQRKIEVLSNGF